jgi:hypothetical protein
VLLSLHFNLLVAEKYQLETGEGLRRKSLIVCAIGRAQPTAFIRIFQSIVI